MPRTRIQLTMDDADFGYLTENSAEWAAIGPEWTQQLADGRFETVPPGGPILATWKRVYWLGAEYATVLLARAFLTAWGYNYQVFSDEAGGWGILTDYEQKREDT